MGPDTFVLPYPQQQGIAPAITNAITNSNGEGEREAEVWFDWAFVDFWKSNYCELFDFATVRTVLSRGR